MAEKIEGRIDHTEDSIQALFQTRYHTYCIGRVLAAAAAGIALVAAGLFAPLPQVAQAVVMLAGCLLFVGRDAPAILQAVRAIDARKGALPAAVCVFDADGMTLRESGAEKTLPYAGVERLVQDRQYLYLFLSAQSVIMVDREKVTPDGAEALMRLVEQRTGKAWEARLSLLTLSLRDLLRLRQSRRARRS